MGTSVPFYAFIIMGFFDTISKIAAPLSSLIGGGMSLIGGAINNSNQKKAEQRQQQYWKQQHDILRGEQLQDYETQKKDQRQLIMDEASLQKQGLINAGLSPAALGDSFSPNAGISDMATQSPSGVQTAASNQGDLFAQAGMQFLNAQLIKAQTRKTESEAKGAETAAQRAQEEYENWRSNLKWIENEIKANEYLISGTEADKRNAEYQKLQKEIEIIGHTADMVKQDADIHQRMLHLSERELQKKIDYLDRQIRSTDKDIDLKEIEKGFKELGIGVGTDYISSLAAILSSPKGHELGERVVNNIFELIKRTYNAVKANVKSALNPFD